MQVCPEVFEVRSDGYLYILQEEPPRGAARQGRARPPTCARRAPSRSRSDRTGLAAPMGFHERSPGLVAVGLDAVRRARSRSGRVPGAARRRARRHRALLHARSSTPPPTSSARSSRSSPTSPSQRAEPALERRLPLHPRDATPTSCSCSTPSAATSARPPSTTPREAFGRYGADAVTVNPYLGTDAVAPFLAGRRRAGAVPHQQPGQRRAAGPRRRRQPAVSSASPRWWPPVVAARRVRAGRRGDVPGPAGRGPRARRRPADPAARRRRPGRRPRGVGRGRARRPPAPAW